MRTSAKHQSAPVRLEVRISARPFRGALIGTKHQPDRWALTVARDEPLPDDELAAIDNPNELALCAGITRQAAHQRLQKRAEQAQKDST